MNERIRELAEQAELYAVRDNSSMLLENWKKHYTEKLDELMVEEFDLIRANEYLDCVGENDKKSQVRIDRLRNRVKEYLGVE
jgi:hypothetical protein